MKFSKITLIILGVVILGVAFGYLYMTYTRQLDEQAQLKSKVTTNQATLSRLVTERETIQAQLTKLEEQLALKRAAVTTATLSLNAAKSQWPKVTESIEYDEIIFGLAGGWNLDIAVVSAGDAVAKTVQGIGFTTNTFAVSVSGPPLTAGFAEAAEYQTYVYRVVGDILGFIDAMAKDKNFATARIDIFNMSVPPLLTKEELLEQGLDVPQPAATVSVTVYTYKGG